MVEVHDFTPETLRAIVAHLEASTDFEHLVYREAELDAIWSLTGFALSRTPDETIARLHRAAHQAHDLVGEGRPKEAAALLGTYALV